MSSAKLLLEAFLSLLFLLSLSPKLWPFLSRHLFSQSLSFALIPIFLAALLFSSVPKPHLRFANVTGRQNYSDIIVLITTSGGRGTIPLTCVVSGRVWSNV